MFPSYLLFLSCIVHSIRITFTKAIIYCKLFLKNYLLTIKLRIQSKILLKHISTHKLYCIIPDSRLHRQTQIDNLQSSLSLSSFHSAKHFTQRISIRPYYTFAEESQRSKRDLLKASTTNQCLVKCNVLKLWKFRDLVWCTGYMMTPKSAFYVEEAIELELGS